MSSLFDPSDAPTIRQAATACRKSTDTIERRKANGLLPNAYRDPNDGHGRWLIPVLDLVNAGLLQPSDVSSPATLVSGGAETVSHSTEVAALRAELQAKAEEVVFLRSLVERAVT